MQLTLKADGLLNVLISDINVHVPRNPNKTKISAIWDTGATNTVITKKVADELGLVPTGMTQMNTANGVAFSPTFIVDIGFEKGLLIQSVKVSQVDDLSGGCDALIGMDIISIGDFSITNHNRKTCMSFRFPSSHEIDYVKNPNFGIIIPKPTKSSTYDRRDNKKGKKK